MRYRLKPEEIKLLGLEPNKTSRYRLTEDLEDKLLAFRQSTDSSIIDCSAIVDGRKLGIKEYCEVYNLDYENIKTWKFLPYKNPPVYNIEFQKAEVEQENDVDWDLIKKNVAKQLKVSNKLEDPNGFGKGVLVLSDLHLGAYVSGLINTPDFNISSVVDALEYAARRLNAQMYEQVDVLILGDLIESFTGLNHKNSWKGLGKGMFGANVIKLTTDILGNFLEGIFNLGKVKIVGGNHDRLTSDNKEDTNGGAADIIAWALNLKGYDVEFNSLVISHSFDGINYVMAHGDKSISKKSAKEIAFDFGSPTGFNFILEGHLHSRFIKRTAKEIQTNGEDDRRVRRIICPSIFTGNSYSQDLGYTSTSGFLIIENNGRGLPNVFDYTI
jgi:calcineurin-like phosphoesterase family protein